MWELSGNPCSTTNAGPLPGKSRTYTLPRSRSTRCSVNAGKTFEDSLMVRSFAVGNGRSNLTRRVSGMFHGAEKRHELVADQVGGLVLDPVADIVEFEPAHQARQTGTHLVDRQRIEFFQAVRIAPNEKRGLRDLGAFESGGQGEIRFGRAIVVQAAVEARALKLGDVVLDVVRLRP